MLLKRAHTRGAILALVPLALVAGCSSSPRVEPIVSGGGPVTGSTRGEIASHYEGPPIRVEGVAGAQQVIVEAPSPGWAVTLDDVRPGSVRSEVRVTITRPNPQFLYPQMVVTQRIATGLDAGAPALVGVRVLDFAQSGHEVPYVAAFVAGE
ncbi:MAG: hypothetical protein RBS39_13495 [Phycisphaerales bacterium]|jgi:hypothetical protein|nr:hypothetical protein [Phycisphaerales bacterium]